MLAGSLAARLIEPRRVPERRLLPCRRRRAREAEVKPLINDGEG